jgi:hypothetical protein
MGYPELNLTSLHALSVALESLEAAVESADAAPTPDQTHAFDVITHLLATKLNAVPHTVCGIKM